MTPIPTEQEVRAFVGPNADFYLRAWRPASPIQKPAPQFNFAAFSLPLQWLAYRKMFKVAIILYGIFLVVNMAMTFLSVAVLKTPASPSLISGCVGVMVIFVTVRFGNTWYLSHTLRVIAEVRSLGLEEAVHLEELAKRGGTNLGASLGLTFAFAVVAFVVQAAMAGMMGQR